MLGESNMEKIDVKRIKIEDNHKKLRSFGVTCRNSVVHFFKNKCIEFYTKQLDDKSVRANNTFKTSDVQNMKEHENVLSLKRNKLMLKEDTSTKISQIIKSKIDLDNVLTFHSLSKHYNLAIDSELTLRCIERCFPMVIETQNFLHLDFSFVSKILSSSELDIHTEVEIFNAVITWLKYNSEQRSKYAKQLLLKVRLPFLSEHALKYLSDKVFSITEIYEVINIFKKVLENKTYFKSRSNFYYTSRYCKQIKYNLLTCGGFDERLNEVVSKVQQIDGSNISSVKVLAPMIQCREYFQSVLLKGEVYAIGGFDNARNFVKSVEKYSPSTNTWNKVTSMFDDHRGFCACPFMDKIFIFGGRFFCNSDVDDYKTTNSCLQFETKDKSWKEMSRTVEERVVAACAVFKQNIIVSGGMDNNDEDLNSVESYDVFADKWSKFPNMINGKSLHNLVVVKDKLFVIGEGNSNCEVFDNFNEKFVALESSYTLYSNKAMSIGNKIVILQHNSSSVISYDVDKDEWSEESSDAIKNFLYFLCVKVPQY